MKEEAHPFRGGRRSPSDNQFCFSTTFLISQIKRAKICRKTQNTKRKTFYALDSKVCP